MWSDRVFGVPVYCFIRVVVVGDHGTGKSSLIAAAASENFSESVSPVLPASHLPADYYSEGVPVIIIDTASSHLPAEYYSKGVPVIIIDTASSNTLKPYKSLIAAAASENFLESVSPILPASHLPADYYSKGVPVIIIDTASSLEGKAKLEEELTRVDAICVYKVFYCAQKAVLHPITSLFDQESQRLSRQYIRALERIFILCDHDMDGALNDRELNEFQVKCFSRPLQSFEIVGFKIIVWERVPEGVNEYGITLVGFLFLHSLMIEKGRTPMAWTVLLEYVSRFRKIYVSLLGAHALNT
nr:mitochondrial Rho GTPase 1 [Tanacetum cinerariifolium]